MSSDHPIFSNVKKVIEEMLMPGRCVGCREATEADGQQVHVKVGYLSPGVESRG